MVNKSLQRSNRIQRVIPGGTVKTIYQRKAYGKHQCGLCGQVLHGVPRGSPSDIKKMSKSQRSPSRPFGGVLCSPCTANIISIKARVKHGEMKTEDTPISARRFL